MWWKFRRRFGDAPRDIARVDPWLYAKADEPAESESVARAFFVAFYERAGHGVSHSEMQAVSRVDMTRLRAAGEVAGRQIYYEANSVA